MVSSTVLIGSGCPGPSPGPEFTDMMLSWFIVFYLLCWFVEFENNIGGFCWPTALPEKRAPGAPYMLDLKL